jgi:hypothetical protein
MSRSTAGLRVPEQQQHCLNVELAHCAPHCSALQALFVGRAHDPTKSNATLSDRFTKFVGCPRKCAAHIGLPSARPHIGRRGRIHNGPRGPDDSALQTGRAAAKTSHRFTRGGTLGTIPEDQKPGVRQSLSNPRAVRVPRCRGTAAKRRRDAVEVGVQSDAQRVSKRPRSFDQAITETRHARHPTFVFMGSPV